MRTALLVLTMVMFGGCATNSGVLPLGPDTYTITTQADMFRGGGAGARQTAIGEAQQHCAEMQKEYIATNIYVGGFVGGGNSVELTFRCLAKGDPDLARPVYRQTPDVVIEDRRGK